jgi:tripartite-type tricarboxylate transporter receptor subunit TctC
MKGSMMIKRLARLARVTAMVLLAGVAAGTSAQVPTYPTKPIIIVVPFGPGGSGDITARLFGKFLEDRWKVPVVIENRSGAIGLIGTEYLKNARNDGYTLAISSGSTHAAAPYLYKRLPYDPVKDFEHVGLFGLIGSVALVPANSPFKTIPELVSYSRSRPGKVFFGYYNTSSQIPGEMLKVRAQIPVEGVPYKNVGNAVADLMGGQTQLMFMDYMAAMAHVNGGRVVPIAVSEQKRTGLWPQVPAVAEFYEGFDIPGYLALSAPAGTPKPVVNMLNVAMRDAMATPSFRNRMESLGVTPRDYSPDEYRAFVIKEIANWAAYTKAAKIEPQ